MAKRQEPIRKSVKNVLEDLLAGHREAAFSWPESALKYLRRAFEAQDSMPNAVKAVAYDLYADAQAQCGWWEDCAASVGLALGFLPDLAAAFPHEYRQMLESMTCFERGVQANSELGDFHAALDLCERAIALELGAHYEAKRDSLEWASNSYKYSHPYPTPLLSTSPLSAILRSKSMLAPLCVTVASRRFDKADQRNHAAA